MKRNIAGITIAIGILLAGLAGTADAGGRARGAHRTQRMTPSSTAVAALSPVGAATGWGRIKVDDRVTRDGVARRHVTAELFALEPSAQYTLIADEVVLGQVMTDASGWAVLKLESPSIDDPPVPEDLPPATKLLTAAVVDSSGAFALEGNFVRVGGNWDGHPNYQERIVLEDVAGANAAGIAKVESEDTSRQAFETRATGLAPGDQYRIVVDGFEAGLVTADAVGQARLRLATTDVNNPLPPEMTPVQDIRQVQWLDPADEIILSGTFTGVPGGRGNDSFGGIITAMAADGFTLQGGMGAFQVLVTANTIFENFSSLDDLAVGDTVHVEGTLDAGVITAYSIELKDHRGNNDSFGGIITAMATDGFTLQGGMGTFQVLVTANTAFENFSSLDDLAVGDTVHVEGILDAGVITAYSIELKDHRGNNDSFGGIITAMATDGFTLQGGMGTFQVLVTADTIFENFSSLDDLAVGDTVHVEGTLDAGVITAYSIELKDHRGNNDSFGGIITAMATDGFTLQGGMGTFQVLVTADTIFENFSSLDDLAVGDTVHVEGTLDAGVITAYSIELKDHGGGGGGRGH